MAENEIVLSERALKSNDDILMYGVAASALSPRAGIRPNVPTWWGSYASA